jgi:hypothetical protein
MELLVITLDLQYQCIEKAIEINDMKKINNIWKSFSSKSKEKKEEIPALDIGAKGQKRTSRASAVEYNSILKLDQSVLFKKFKDNISDTEILKDFENLHALYKYSADNETIILECTSFFSDRITESNKIDDLQLAITKIDKTLIIKHRCIYRNDIIIYPNNSIVVDLFN